MKARHLLFLAASLLVLTGCVVTSVYPFYTAKDVKFDTTLTGGWTNTTDAADRWVFVPTKTNSYQLTYTTKDSTNTMQATLFKLQNHSFLDILTAEISDQSYPPPIPAHSLIRLTQTNLMLTMTPMDYEWLAKVLDENPKALRHHLIRDPEDTNSSRLVLTADTADLQKFIIKHLGTAAAWKNPCELKKDASKTTTR
jgi:hypothetical protein